MDSTPKPAPEKKPYRAPSLQHYGNLIRITSTVMGTMNLDGGTNTQMNRTS